VGIRKFDDSTLNLVAFVHQEDVPCREFHAPHDDGVSSSTNHPQVGLPLQAHFTAGQIQSLRSLHRDIQLDVLRQSLAVHRLWTRLNLAGQGREVEVLGKAQAVDEYTAAEICAFAGSFKVEVAIEHGTNRILVANAHIVRLESHVHLQLRSIAYDPRKGNPSPSALAVELSDIDLVIADVENAIQVLNTHRSIGKHGVYALYANLTSDFRMYGRPGPAQIEEDLS